MISGYLPVLINLVLLLSFCGGIEALDRWLKGQKLGEVDLARATLIGFVSGCMKASLVLVMAVLGVLAFYQLRFLAK
jgi:hypothetical protein